MSEIPGADVSASVVARLSRAYNGAYIACADDDNALDSDCHRAALGAVIAHLRAHPEDAAAVLGPQPTVYAHDDGTTVVDWPDGVTSCVMSREALDGYAENVNGAWRALNEAQRDLDSMRRMLDSRRAEATP